jgi:SAM-dependent methyltransferase
MLRPDAIGLVMTPPRTRSTLKRLIPSRYVDRLRVRWKFGGDRDAAKRHDELGFWQELKESQSLWNGHFEGLYTTTFGLDRGFYEDKAILDIGCGPLGSLEWAPHARLRVGLDPLADDYRSLGTDDHEMSYAAAGSEAIPFPDAHFDVVSALNSLDHVDNLPRTVAEIVRVLSPGGTFLLITEVCHPPTVTEPLSLEWEVTEMFSPQMRVMDARRYEKGQGVYDGVLEDERYRDDGRKRPGVLVARLEKG